MGAERSAREEDFNMRRLQTFIILAASFCLVGGIAPRSSAAADKLLKIEEEWKGSRKDVDDDAYVKDLDGKDEAVITSAKAWAKLWKA